MEESVFPRRMGGILPRDLKKNVPGIVAHGYDNSLSVRQMYGDGIYSAPDPKVAEGFG